MTSHLPQKGGNHQNSPSWLRH